MRTSDLLQYSDIYYGRILRIADVRLKNPVHQRAAKRIICSCMTSIRYSIADMMREMTLTFNQGSLIDEDVKREQLYSLLVDVIQYEGEEYYIEEIRPFFDASGWEDLFECIVECLQAMGMGREFIKYDFDLKRYTGFAPYIAPFHVTLMKNHIRTAWDLQPVTTNTSCTLAPFFVSPIVILYMFRKWKANMLKRRLREYMRCLHRTRLDSVTGTRDVMGLIVSALGL